MRIMRKMTGFLGAMAVSALILGGCSSASSGTETTVAVSESSTQEASQSAESTTAESTAAESQTETQTDAVSSASLQGRQDVDEMVYQNEEGQTVVSHKYGETVVPENPERVVCLKLEDLMLALGADMVACQKISGYYLEEQIDALGIGSVAVDEESNTVNLEQVLSYQPDLIVIRDSFDQSVYDELSAIAPTIAFHLQTPTSSILALGKALGMEEEAEARLVEYGDKIAAAKEKLSAVAGEEVAMLRIMQKEIRLYPYSSSDLSRFLYDELGLTPDPKAIEYDNADSFAISMESLPDLTAKHIFVVAGYGTASDENVAAARERFDSIKADPLWQNVPAVQSGNIYEVDSRVWLTHGILAVERKIEDVVQYLAPESAN